MKISELQSVLSEYLSTTGDIEVTFMMAGRDDMICEIEVDIALAYIEKKPFLGFILENSRPHSAVLQ